LTFSALLLVLGSAVLHAGWSAAIKSSRDPLCFNLLQVGAHLLLLTLLLPWIDLREVPPAAWRFLAATGIAHGGYFYWMSRAYEQGDLTLVYPIARSTPAFLPLLAVPLLGDPITPAGAAGIAIVVGGMWLVPIGAGFRWAAFRAPGAGYAYLTLAATVAYSFCDKGAMVALTRAPWTSPVPRAVFYCLAIGSASALVFAPLVVRRRGWTTVRAVGRKEAARAAAAALVSLLSYGMILESLRSAPVSYVVAVRQSSVLFALVLGVTWLGERPDRLRLVGAVATVLGVVLIALAGEAP